MITVYGSTLDKKKEGDIRLATKAGFSAGLAELVTYTIQAVIFWCGARFQCSSGGISEAWCIDNTIEDGSITISALEKMLTAIYGILMAIVSVGTAITLAPDLMSAIPAAERITRLLDLKPTINVTSTNGQKPARVKGSLVLQNVKFAYPERANDQVANGLDLHMPAGKTTALVGPSGSGKSTVIQLLERFYDPVSGSVSLDGIDLKSLNLAWLRSQIGLVGQEPVLFAGTIAENIAIGKPGATLAEVEEASKMSNAYNFIVALPDQFQTGLGATGTQLSGGQKQRIAIARAIIRNPAVLLLDEATSALDNESEREVQSALDRLYATHARTMVVVAHRLATIRHADIIAVVHHGRIVEQGTHDELAKIEGGHYHVLLKGQCDNSVVSRRRTSATVSMANLHALLQGPSDGSIVSMRRTSATGTTASLHALLQGQRDNHTVAS